MFDLEFCDCNKNNKIKANTSNITEKKINISKLDNKNSINILHIIMIFLKIAISNLKIYELDLENDLNKLALYRIFDSNLSILFNKFLKMFK